MSEVFIDNMLIRLKAYRKEKSMSQEKFADYLGVKQTYYSQIENGKISLSHGILENLYRFDCNIDYIVTGVQKDYTDKVLIELLETCESDYVIGLYSAMINGFFQTWTWNLEDQWEKCLYSELRVMGLLSFYEIDLDKKLHYIRLSNGISQQEFSDILGIGRTKCGKCEYGETQLDAQLMINLYSGGLCLPSFFLEKYIGIDEISCLLETDVNRKNRYYAYVNSYITNFINF